MMTQPLIYAAALYTALHILLFIGLSFLVVRERFSSRIGLGFADNKLLQRLVRIHGNAAEYIGPLLIVLLFLALLDAPAWSVHAYGLITLSGRILHAAGLYSSSGVSFGRTAGTAITWSSLILGSLGLILIIFTRL